MRIVQTLGLLGVLVFGGIAAANWPVFQGDGARTGQGGKRPSIKKPAIIWKANIGIQGYLNNPVFVDGRVYVGSSGKEHNRPDAKDGVYCLDAATGRVIWRVRTKKDACGAAWADGRLFATSDDGALRCLDAKSGKLLWKMQRKGELYCQPLVVKGLVLIGDASGTIVGADQKTGAVVWQKKFAETNVRGGLSSDGELIVAVSVAGKVVCCDIKGKELWSSEIFPQNKKHWTAYPTPTIADRRVIVGYARDTNYDTPSLWALDIKSGGRIWGDAGKWDRRRPGPTYANIRSSVTVWGKVLLYGTAYGNSLVAVDSATGKESWRLDVGVPMFPHWPSAAVAGQTLYLPRHDGGLYAIDLKERKLKWKIYLGQAGKDGVFPPTKEILGPDSYGCEWKPAVGKSIYASPALTDKGRILIGTGQGFLFCIGEKD
jgi:outer membrane protein assembly factor BamB